MSLAAIPLPVRIIGLMLLMMLGFRLLSGQTVLLFILAGLLWTVVIVALLYDNGPLASLGSTPGLGAALDWLTNRRTARAAPARVAAMNEAEPDAEQPRGTMSDAERATLLDRAYAALDGLPGQAAAVEQIETRLFEPIRNAIESDGPSFGTRAPALAVLISGPAGVGVREVAFAIARGIAGLGALDRTHIAELRARDVRNDPGDAATRKAEEARGGVLLISDADWLLDPDQYGGGMSPGVEAGLAILDVAERDPGRFVVIVTLPNRMEDKLRADPGHRRWLDKLAVRAVRLQALGDDDLYALLTRELQALGAEVDPEAERAAKALLREVRDTQGDSFDNAEACRRLAEQIHAAHTEIAIEDDAEPLSGGETRVIARRHVLRAQETWE